MKLKLTKDEYQHGCGCITRAYKTGVAFVKKCELHRRNDRSIWIAFQHPKTKEKTGMKKITEDEWLEFWLEEEKSKTKIYSVISKCSNIELGKIKWYPPWRHYCFVLPDEVFSDRCMLAIGNFTLKLNEEHKNG